MRDVFAAHHYYYRNSAIRVRECLRKYGFRLTLNRSDESHEPWFVVDPRGRVLGSVARPGDAIEYLPKQSPSISEVELVPDWDLQVWVHLRDAAIERIAEIEEQVAS